MVLDWKFFQEYPVNARVSQRFVPGPTLFLLYLNDLPDDICLSMLMILLSILIVIRHLLCGINLNWRLNLNRIYKTLWTGARSGLLISMLGKLDWLRLTSLITLVLLMWKWMGLFWEKTSFKMLGLTFSSKLDWWPYIISIAKSASKCYLELLDKLQIRICRTVGLSLAASLEPLAHCRIVTGLSLFYRYFQGLIQAVFNIGISILGTLIWACLNLILRKTETTIKGIFSFLIKPVT